MLTKASPATAHCLHTSPYKGGNLLISKPTLGGRDTGDGEGGTIDGGGGVGCAGEGGTMDGGGGVGCAGEGGTMDGGGVGCAGEGGTIDGGGVGCAAASWLAAAVGLM